MITWKQGKPEDKGIPQSAVDELERLFVSRNVRVYGYMLLSGDSILTEKYFQGYDKDSLHRMYSIAKTFVALAVGLLEKNGLVCLDDKICDYFPEKLGAGGAHPWCAELTIRDMLSMRTCHGDTTYKNYPGGDWTESFFRVEPDHIPGTVFSYDTSSSHVLGALVEKLTGKKLLDYMRQEFLDELGFSKAAYLMEDPVGVSQGGSGIMCTLRDVAVVASLCSRGGMLDGKQLLSESFLREALKKQVPTDIQPKLDEQFGYGYFIWMPREEGFTFFGMGGQLAVCFPKYDLCYLTMADTLGFPAGLQILHDCFYQTIWPYLAELSPETGEMAVCPTDGIDISERENYAREEARIREWTQGQTFTFYPNKMGWEKIVFDWEAGILKLTLPEGEFSFTFGEHEYRSQQFLDTGYACQCTGYWKMGHFILKCFVTGEELGNVQMDFAWKDNRFSVRVVSTPDPFQNGLHKRFKGFASAQSQKTPA